MSKNVQFNRLHDLLDRMNVVNSGNNKAEDKPELSDQFAAYILWLDSEPMIPERTYSIHFQNESTIVQVTDLSFKINIKTLSQLAAKKLEQDEIGYCKLSLSQRVPFDTLIVTTNKLVLLQFLILQIIRRLVLELLILL